MLNTTMEALMAGSDANAEVTAWLREFVEAALRPREVDEFVRTVDDEILAAIPVLAGDASLAEELHASTREHWRNFLVSLSGEHRLALPPAAVALGLSIARRNHDVSVLLKIYRVANRVVFRYVAEHTATDSLPPSLPRDEALLALWLRADRWIDESIERLVEYYTRERATLVEGAQARRAETIEALVAGAVPTGEAERVLGHRFALWQTAFVLSAPPHDDEGAPLFDLALRVCQELGLPRPLTMLAGSRELWGWVATPEEPVLALDGVEALLATTGIHLALGASGQGPGAFRLSHVQAVAAQRIGLRAPALCHPYADVELVSLVGDGELARELVRRTLGPLLSGAKGDDVLRGTILAYLRSGQSFDAAADGLFVHPNTVRYRIARAEEQLGHRIAPHAAALEVCLAWLEVYGEPALA
ncbi:MAG TPA: helix-turn-helix domain-containing protein [Nocardioides sp.]|nr:helix-turn-helix domain-containing protein [Nocardioides sp.]